jgi:hypothetical protein
LDTNYGSRLHAYKIVERELKEIEEEEKGLTYQFNYEFSKIMGTHETLKYSRFHISSSGDFNSERIRALECVAIEERKYINQRKTVLRRKMEEIGTPIALKNGYKRCVVFHVFLEIWKIIYSICVEKHSVFLWGRNIFEMISYCKDVDTVYIIDFIHAQITTMSDDILTSNLLMYQFGDVRRWVVDLPTRNRCGKYSIDTNQKAIQNLMSLIELKLKEIKKLMSDHNFQFTFAFIGFIDPQPPFSLPWKLRVNEAGKIKGGKDVRCVSTLLKTNRIVENRYCVQCNGIQKNICTRCIRCYSHCPCKKSYVVQVGSDVSKLFCCRKALITDFENNRERVTVIAHYDSQCCAICLMCSSCCQCCLLFDDIDDFFEVVVRVLENPPPSPQINPDDQKENIMVNFNAL